MANQDRNWNRIAKLRQVSSMLASGPKDLLRVRMCAMTFREDPLPERTITDRGVSLPRVRWLERPDP